MDGSCDQFQRIFPPIFDYVRNGPRHVAKTTSRAWNNCNVAKLAGGRFE